MKNKKIIVHGSIAFDYIMDFPGTFSDHILPDQIHKLNVAFTIGQMQKMLGGTGANIAYNLGLLGLKPILTGVAGQGFADYKKWLTQNGVNTSHVEHNRNIAMAGAYITTDKNDNQITAFFPGPQSDKYPSVIDRIKKIGLAIISPDSLVRMLGMIKKCQARQIPYIFDPGQQTTSFGQIDLKKSLSQAYVLVCNDYEFELIKKISGLSAELIRSKIEIVVITKGAKGSEIYHKQKLIKIPPAKPKNVSDPTGAGDAFRAGLIFGLTNGWPLEKTGRLAGLISVYTVEKYGTQTHSFTWTELKARYRRNYGKTL